MRRWTIVAAAGLAALAGCSTSVEDWTDNTTGGTTPAADLAAATKVVEVALPDADGEPVGELLAERYGVRGAVVPERAAVTHVEIVSRADGTSYDIMLSARTSTSAKTAVEALADGAEELGYERLSDITETRELDGRERAAVALGFPAGDQTTIVRVDAKPVSGSTRFVDTARYSATVHTPDGDLRLPPAVPPGDAATLTEWFERHGWTPAGWSLRETVSSTHRTTDYSMFALATTDPGQHDQVRATIASVDGPELSTPNVGITTSAGPDGVMVIVTAYTAQMVG